MNMSQMYLDAPGRLDAYRLGGLKAMFVGVVVVVMFAGSIITSILSRILPAFSIIFAELFAVAELIAPLFLLWLILKKAHGFWDALREQLDLQIPDTGRGLLRVFPLFYAGVIGMTVLCAIALWIIALTNRTLTIDQVPQFLLVIGGSGMILCVLSWFLVLPLYFWRKLTGNTKLICRQIGYRYDDLVRSEGGWVLFGGGLITIVFWTFLICFQPLRLMFRAIKHHDALIDLMETNTGLILEEV